MLDTPIAIRTGHDGVRLVCLGAPLTADAARLYLRMNGYSCVSSLEHLGMDRLSRFPLELRVATIGNPGEPTQVTFTPGQLDPATREERDNRVTFQPPDFHQPGFTLYACTQARAD